MSAEDDDEKLFVTPFLRKLPNGGLSWYDLMDRMIGSKKQRFSDVMVPRVGIPQTPRLPEEIRIQRAMDSCLFKSVMSCVIGECHDPWLLKFLETLFLKLDFGFLRISAFIAQYLRVKLDRIII